MLARRSRRRSPADSAATRCAALRQGPTRRHPLSLTGYDGWPSLAVAQLLSEYNEGYSAKGEEMFSAFYSQAKKMISAFADKWLFNPRWRTVRHLGRLPILGVSAATIVLVPLLAKVIDFLQKWSSKLAKDVSQNVPQFSSWLQAFSESLTLPFVLKLLAISALLAIVGKIIYILFCPPYIKYGDSFNEFRHAHSDALMVLTDDFIELWNSSNEEEQGEIVRYLLNSYGLDFFNSVSRGAFIHESLTRDNPVGFRIGDLRGGARTGNLITLMNNPIFGEAIFVRLRESRDDIRKWSRRLCAIIYYAATAFAGWALYIQGEWVIRGILN